MSRIQFSHTYEHIISLENLLAAWQEFVRGKRRRKDVQEFERNLMANILALHRDLAAYTYAHSAYQAFNISDPKPRIIHKASVRDRLLHRALYRKLYPFFDKTFIADSFSCRIGKGTHRAMNRFRSFGRIVSKNNTRTCWVLKCDIRKFFASVDHSILLAILKRPISDERVMGLLERVIRSFASTAPGKPRNTTLADPLCGSRADAAKVDIRGKGLPLGNLTSQLFANVCLNELDHFVKHILKARYYVRYADDFVFLSENRGALERILPLIDDFLRGRLNLALHPDKVFIKTFASGVDFLGWVHYPLHRVLRTSTKRRMIRRVMATQKQETIDSYLGLLRHGNAYGLQEWIAQTDTKSPPFSL